METRAFNNSYRQNNCDDFHHILIHQFDSSDAIASKNLELSLVDIDSIEK